MTTPNRGSDMADFFDFGEAAMLESQENTILDFSNLPNEESHASNDSTGEPSQLTVTPTKSAEFNTDFSSWLPRYQKPVQPCEYCRSKSLECFIYNSGQEQSKCCSPCNALFRPCSFSNPDKTQVSMRGTALDTLDVVTENDAHQYGGLTGRKQLRSLGHVGPIEDENEGEQGSKKGAAATRFPRAATKILKDWMIAHIDHPYPTEEEKEALMQQTGLSLGQVSNWMANTRRRYKSRPKRNSSPSIRPSTAVINIPAGRTWESLNPFERWKHSPPENEPAPLTAIAQAVETFDPPESASLSSSYHKDTSNHSTGSFSIFKAPSISSLETGFTNMSSGSLGSHNSAYSYGSRHSLGSMTSLKSKERRRRRRLPTRPPKADASAGPRLFQCTFCTDQFKSKYDWSRHEKSLHLSLEKWLCAPIGEIVADKTTGKPRCVYCDELDPSKEHLSTHNHVACYEKGPESRTFYRKDHLRQHLRLMHGCKMIPSMDSWKSEAQYIKSRCGFCGMTFEKWQERVDHLAKEFRSGADMKNWKGCRGLDPHVAMHVTNAMPPYLIGNEKLSPFPFCASNSASLQQANILHDGNDLENLLANSNGNSPTSDLSAAYQKDANPSTIGPMLLTTPKDYTTSSKPTAQPNATCWEILTLRLGKFTREYMAQHGAASMTDALLQREARNILYSDPDDTWNQTSADNPEWLALFKRAHGLDTSTPASHLPLPSSPHTIYEDLGLHANTTLDPSFNMHNFPTFAAATTTSTTAQDRAAIFQCTLTGSTRFGPPHSSTLPPSTSTSTSISPPCLQNLQSPYTKPPLSLFDPISELACAGPNGPCFGENGEPGFSTRIAGSSHPRHTKRYWLDGAPGAQVHDVLDLQMQSAVEAVTQDAGCMDVQGGFEGLPWEADLLGFGVEGQGEGLDGLGTGGKGDGDGGVDVHVHVGVGVDGSGSTAQGWDDGEFGFTMDLDGEFDFGGLGGLVG
ncbi:hypothetical protein IAQ61_009877, partial [Plenodomus lingam]|uniref:uncharacterized protein n=1 Tax=Leptosphaeria maculans TaxID=5022 RepID=UPI003324FDD6